MVLPKGQVVLDLAFFFPIATVCDRRKNSH